MAEYKRQVGLNVTDQGIGQATRSAMQPLLSIADVVARREQDIIRNRQQQGKKAGTDAGIEGAQKQEVPEDKAGFLDWAFGKSAFNEAYNAAAEDSYLDSTEARVRRDILELEAQSPSNVAEFGEKLSQYRNDMVESSGDLGAIVGEVVDRYGANSASKVMTAQREWGLKQIGANLKDAELDAEEQLMDAVRAGDDDGVGEGVTRLITNLNKQLNLGLIETDAYNKRVRDVENEVIAQDIYRTFDEQFDIGQGDDYIVRLMDKGIKGYEGDPEKVYTELNARLRRRVSLEEAEEQSESAARTERYREGERVLGLAELDNDISFDMIDKLYRNDQISAATADKYKERITKGPTLHTDRETVLAVETNLLEYTEDDIRGMLDIGTDERSRLIQMRQEMADSWRSEQWAREHERRIRMEIGLPDGPLDSADSNLVKEANRAITEWYDSVDGLDPAKRRQESKAMVRQVTRDHRINNIEKEIEGIQESLNLLEGSDGPLIEQRRTRAQGLLKDARARLEKALND